MAYSREQRVAMNSKEQAVSSGDVKGALSHSPSARNMDDGEQVYARQSNKPLALYKKFKGVLWKSYFSKDGDEIIDRDLKVDRNIIVNGVPYYKNLPAFSVYQSSSSDEQAMATGYYTRITLDTELYDIGGNFGSSVFTAPVNGIYTFSGKILWDNNADADAGDWDAEERHDAVLFKNESSSSLTSTSNRVAASLRVIQGALTDKIVMNSITVDLKLNSGDYIGLYGYQDSGVEQHTFSTNIDDWTQFSGRLVTAI